MGGAQGGRSRCGAGPALRGPVRCQNLLAALGRWKLSQKMKLERRLTERGGMPRAIYSVLGWRELQMQHSLAMTELGERWYVCPASPSPPCATLPSYYLSVFFFLYNTSQHRQSSDLYLCLLSLSQTCVHHETGNDIWSVLLDIPSASHGAGHEAGSP